MRRITDLELFVLESLAEFHYLTAKQLARLKVGRDPDLIDKRRAQYRNTTLRDLLAGGKPLIAVKSFGTLPGVGRLQDVFRLTRYGAEAVAHYQGRAVSEITYPEHGLKYSRDYMHRLDFVDFHIELAEHLKAAPDGWLEFFQPYFYNQKGTNQSINYAYFRPEDGLFTYGHKGLEPDAIAKFRLNGRTRLCLIEIHREPHYKHITRQLENYITALSQGLFEDLYQSEDSAFVLSVHTTQKSFMAVRERLAQHRDFPSFKPAFVFGHLDTLKTDFANTWIDTDQNRIPIFQHD